MTPNQITAAQYQALPSPAKKTSKYRARKVEIDGIVFDSKAEAKYYRQLQLQVAAGEIESFDCQVPYALIVNGDLVATYVADFVTYEKGAPSCVIDVKGYTKGQAYAMFRLKQKLVKALYGIDVKVVKL